ncbi:MAG TPA: acyltransferase [Roseiarcus sp.]|nr:acyltransferase [Roseiarcus sp.]
MNAFAKPPLPTASRNAGIDALRASLTLLVVFHHAAIAYGGMGSWFYKEIEPSSAPSSLILTLFVAYNQAFFMGLFFLIAGSLTPGAIARHGAQEFLRERLLRLGAPLLVFILTLGPITVALAETANGHAFLATLGWLASHRAIIPGPMWFVEALLIFSAAYVALRAAVGPERLEKARPFPSNAVLAMSALGTGAAAFLLRFRWPVGAEFLALQFGFFASYVVLFLAGCIGAKGHWLKNVPANPLITWRRVSLYAALGFPVGLVVAAHASNAAQASSSGGWSVAAAFYAFWEPLFAWGVILSLLVFFQRRFVALGPAWQKLARRAYLIYIIHPPILVGVSLAMRALGAGAGQVRARGHGGLRSLLHRRRSAARNPGRPARRLAGLFPE